MHKGMRKHFALAAVFGCLATNTFAVAPGLYLGLLFGPATNSGKTQYAQVEGSAATTPANPKSSQWGTQVFLGYKMNQYAAVEGALTLFSKIQYDTKGVPTCTDPSVRVRDFEFAGKGSYPFTPYFDVFGKAGVAVIYQTVSGSLNPTGTTDCGKNKYSNRFKPVIGIGADYGLSQSWVVDVSWSRILMGSLPGNVDLLGIGISYHFVDRYCGQFLCDD